MNKKLLAILAGAIISMGFNVAISADNQLTNLGAKTFTIIKTPEPNKFRMENSQFGFGGIVHRFRNNGLSDALSGDLVKANPNFNEFLRTQISNELKMAGLNEILPPEVILDPSDLWKIDYSKVDTESDLIIHAYVDYSGVRSGSTSSFYETAVHVNFCVVAKKLSNKCLIENTAVYGDGASKNSKFVYVASPDHRWENSVAVFENIPEIIKSMNFGLSRIATDVSKAVLNGE